MNDNEEKIYDLITSKSFDELSKGEQAFVLDNLGSKEAYAKMREANLAAMEAMTDDQEVPADLKSSVMEAFDQRSQIKSGIVWWKYAAAVAILAVGAFVFWPAGNPEKVQIAENVEREKPSAEAEVESGSGTKDSDQEGSIEKNDEKLEVEESQNSAQETKAIEEEKLVDDNVSEEREAFSDETEAMDDPIIQSDFAEAKSSDQSEFQEEYNASSEAPAVDQHMGMDKKRAANTLSMSESSMTSKRAMSADLPQNGGVSLSQIGGPFPKAYVAY
ncbi:MAG TPA: hypothetical protein VJ894_08225 [Cryomorphaceae bacterium]|nr:hypothetical protein [Cryomorphaceae bacterium]